MQLEINNVTKAYKKKLAVDHASFVLKNGLYGLLGINGAGKTTLMKMLCGLLELDEGNILLDGIDICKMGQKYYSKLGYLPQEFGYYPEFTAEEYLTYIASVKGLNKQEAKKRIKEVLKIVSLEKVKKQKMRTYSGGMKRRVGIAQAILNSPRILILDEPTVGLDPKERNHFRQLLAELSKDRIVLLSTHIVSDVEIVAGEILLMKEGKLIAKGETDELLSTIKGKVWEGNIQSKELTNIQNQFLISYMRSNKKDMEVRIISDKKPISGAVNAEPLMDDLFMYYFNEQGENYHANV